MTEMTATTIPAPSLHVPGDVLAQAVEGILASPADSGPVQLIVRRPGPARREVLAHAELDPAVGVRGDNWSQRFSRRTPDGSPHPGMAVTLMSTRVVDALCGGDRTRWQLAGDQLYVDLDLSVANLPVGTRLQAGSAVLEVSEQPHTGCAKFADRFGVDALRFVTTGQGRPGRWRGVNVAVVRGGRVSVGELVQKLS